MKRLKIIRDNSLTLKEAFGKFIRNCKIKDLSEYTIIYYEKSFNYFTSYLKSEYDNTENMNIKYLNKEGVNDFIYWLKDNYNMKNVTINTCLRGVRAFLYYLM
jgi:integrase/recombinase XerD